mgnify:CR=1 FL=1
MGKNDDAEFLTAIEIWKMINMSMGLNRIRTYLRDGMIPAKKFGRTYVAKKNDVVSFFENYYLKTQN